MIRMFYPRLYKNSIYDIPFDELLSNGVKGLVFDVDNTLAPYDVKSPDKKLMELFICLKKRGFKICLVSNNKEKRIKEFNSTLKLAAVSKAGKPRLNGIKKALDLIGSSPHQTALIGDQIFTDVLCGNRLKMYTILVKPISCRDEFSVKLKRGLEKIIIRLYLASMDMPSRQIK